MSDSATERKIEDASEARVVEWRHTRSETSALKKEILGNITEKTFHSTKLLRLYTEILIRNSEFEEAYASFDAYVSLQRLSLFKANSGARSLPDSLTEGTVAIFKLMLTTLEQLGQYGEPRIFKLGSQLSEIMDQCPENEVEEATNAFAPIFARVSLVKTLNAETDAEFSSHLDEAKSWFSEVPEDTDADAHYAKALLLALSEGPDAALAAAKAAVTASPDHIRGALLLIQLLTAEQQLEPALALANAYLARSFEPKAIVDKVALIALKKTQIALIEKLKGIEPALMEITEFIGLVNTLFAVGSNGSAKHANGNGVNGHAKELNTSRRIFSFKRRPTAESIASVTSTPSEASPKVIAATNDARIISFSWFWIAQQYGKAGLESEAREALEEGRSHLRSEYELDGYALIQTILGQIEQKSNPQRALKHFLHALSIQPLHISSAIGAALMLSSGTTDEYADQNNETVLSISGALEAICRRTPGRFIPEVWYARGLLYDKLGIPEEARKVYWMVVGLEERRGITTYVNSVTLQMY